MGRENKTNKTNDKTLVTALQVSNQIIAYTGTNPGTLKTHKHSGTSNFILKM